MENRSNNHFGNKSIFSSLKGLSSFILVSLIVLYSCEIQDDSELDELSSTIVPEWEFSQSSKIAEMKQWYQKNSTLDANHRSKGETVEWILAEEMDLDTEGTIVSVPIVEKKKEKGAKLKVMYLFDGSEGISGYIMEQIPDKNQKGKELYLSDRFNGEISIYTLEGKLKTKSKLKNGEMVESFKGSVFDRGLSNVRIKDELPDQILDAVTIWGTRENMGISYVWFTSRDYYNVGIVYPGTQYDGYYGGNHNYLSPTSSVANEGLIIDFTPYRPAVLMTDIQRCFSDGKSVSEYKVTVYVDQPVRNTHTVWDVFTDGNQPKARVGHTFVGFKKINTDGTVVERIMGFYPKNSSVNPIGGDHTDEGIFRDDSGHAYDVAITFNNVSSGNFYDALNYATQIDIYNSQYDLNNRNCTDIGIGVADKAGYDLPDNPRTWPGGGGSSPGELGQDLRNFNCSSCTRTTSPGTAPAALGGGC